jgi:hypothetical protein
MALGRIPRLTKAYLSTVDRLGVRASSPKSQAVSAVVQALAAAEELPLPDDEERPLRQKDAVLVEKLEGRRLLTAFVRRVRGHRLWLWYRPKGTLELELVVLTNVPPGP